MHTKNSFDGHETLCTKILCKNHSVWKTFGDLIPSLIFESFWNNLLLKYFQLLHYILLTNAHFKYTIWYTISAKTLSFLFMVHTCTKFSARLTKNCAPQFLILSALVMYFQHCKKTNLITTITNNPSMLRA